MDNLIFTSTSRYEQFDYLSIKINVRQITKLSYQQATKTIVIIDNESRVYFLQYSSNPVQISVRNSTEQIEELQYKKIVMLEYLVDGETALVLTQNGDVMTISEDGTVSIKAQNQNGITGGSISPAQQYIYIVTANCTLLQLNMEFDLVKEVPLDDNLNEKVQSIDPRFSWKADGSFFAINIQTNKGRKCHTRDYMLGIFRTPSLSDTSTDGLVQSVSQKSRMNMGSLVAWQPSGGIIAGIDFTEKAQKKVKRVIFWQKNSLRHLQFELPEQVVSVLNLTWSQDSQILFVQTILTNSSRWLYLYYRSNYHWYLKNTIKLQQENTKYLFITNKVNQILIINRQKIDVYQFVINISSNNWKNQKQQQQNSIVLQACVDGKILKITDFSKGLIPPPMCHHQAKFQSNIRAVALHNQTILVFTEQTTYLCKWNSQNLDDRKILKLPQNPCTLPINPKLLQIQPTLEFVLNNQLYCLCQQQIIKSQREYRIKPYLYNLKDKQQQLLAYIKQGTLMINNLPYLNHCTSFTLYHEFLLFTTTTSGMYDKMYIIDLVLEQLNQNKEDIKNKLQEFQNKKLFNIRTVERGAKIISCAKNKVVFQMPRGNLQTIYPKVIVIKQVKKCIEQNKFKQAFETIRTHKLDHNLLYDINPIKFTEHTQQILLEIKKIDYLNLFISQIKNQISTQLQYCNTKQEIQQIQSYIQGNLQGKKVKEVCSLVSKALRKNDKQKYILSIFTSDIKMGLLNEVLFEIKQMKKDEKQIIIPPHIQNSNEQKALKKQNAQQILQYICWLVDANIIYEASLQTYDLQLASITARCTQMDPKQYIPYLEQLKNIQNQVELRKRICIDLKKYQKAVEELSKGNQQQIKQSIELIQKHKLFKCGLKSYKSNPHLLKQVKLLLINELLASGQNSQAYNLCLSISQFEKALQLAIKASDGKKIKQVTQCLHENQPRQNQLTIIKKIINDIGEEGFKNKNDLAKLKYFIGQFDQATKLYIRAGNYQKAYKSYIRSSKQQKIVSELTNGMSLLYSLQKNQLLYQKSLFIQKQSRLNKIHKLKSKQNNISFKPNTNLDNADLYSQVSASSQTASNYTISTTTGMRKKKDKKKSILNRNVKQGSPLQEQYLVAFIADLQTKIQSNISIFVSNIEQTKLLIQHLIYINLIEQGQSLRNICREYIDIANKSSHKFYAQIKLETDHPQFVELLKIYENNGIIERQTNKDKYNIDSFNYMF